MMTVTRDTRTADEVLGEFENAVIIVTVLASAPFLARHSAHARLLSLLRQRETERKDGIRDRIVFAIKIHRLGTGQYHRGRNTLKLLKFGISSTYDST